MHEMHETTVTVVGNAATGVDFRETEDGVPVARFRLAATARRWDRRRAAWTEGHISYYTVWAWRSLAANVASSVSLGEPLVVQGRLHIREDEYGGKLRSAAEIEAIALGHDLACGTSVFRRVAEANPALTASSYRS
ncbi:single-stranded DNA-binding protein [Streptomyces sp. NPDC004647]|uniref:single-stranded DNA-binding protein n=1 Tax=Streptomyces sp. NPDC004647 TaxID=3154671 RepID=UPI0033A2DAE2